MERLACILAGLLGLAVAANGRDAGAAGPGTVTGLAYRAEASSTLAKSGRVYGPENLGSLDITKPWCEGKPGSGPGSWLELDFTAEPGRVEAAELLLKIQPGYQKSDRLFVSHARPAVATLELRDGDRGASVTPQDSYRLQFHDRPGIQIFRVPIERPVDPSRLSLRLEIQTAHAGSAFQDLCITEIRAFLADTQGRAVSPSANGEQALVEREIAYLETLAPDAREGDWAALQGFIRLGAGAYIQTAEGGERLNAAYLDLLEVQAHRFLFLLGRQEDALRSRIVGHLLAPMTDRHSHLKLLAAVRRAQQSGVTGTFMSQLARFYRIAEFQAVERPVVPPENPAPPSELPPLP